MRANLLAALLLAAGCTIHNPDLNGELYDNCNAEHGWKCWLGPDGPVDHPVDMTVVHDATPPRDLLPEPGRPGAYCASNDDCLPDPLGRPVKCGPIDQLDDHRHCCVQLQNWICDDRPL